MDDKMVWILPDVEEKEINWELPTWGKGVMYHSPFEIDGWTIAPATPADLPSIPKIAIERVEQMINSGIKLQGILIAHEISPPLTEVLPDLPFPLVEYIESGIVEDAEFVEIGEIPPDFPYEPETIEITSPEEAQKIKWAEGVKPTWWDKIDWKIVRQKGWKITLKVLKVAGIVVGVALVGALAIAAIAGLAAGLGMFLAPNGAMACVLGGDPVLIAVLEDNTWIEVHRWWED